MNPIEEKLNLLPIVPYSASEEFQSVLFSDLFNEIFEYYMNNYSNNTLSNKTEVEQRTSLYLYLTNQDEDLANNINDLIYKRPCPTIEEFLDNPFYMGNISATIYPYWRKKLCEIFDPQNPIKKVLFGGATGTGKSRTAEKACVYALYRLLCLRYPRQVLKVEAQSTLAMFILSVTQKTAYQVLFQPFIELLSNMPCFQRVRQARAFENFDTSDPRCPIPFYVEKGNMTIIFPDNIILTLGSQISNTVGYDIVISECDEMNEKGTEEGMELINSIDGRVDGRFMGSPFTFQAVMSSARAKNSVTSEYNKKWKHDPTFLYLRPMRFEVKTGQNFIGDGSYFFVMAGNGVIPSKIVEDPGELAKLKAFEDENNDHKLGLLDCELAPGCETARVPTIYKPSFEADLDQSIQDILGISTQDQSMVFRDTTRIVDKALLPELKMEINLGDNSRLLDFLPDKLFEMDLSGKYRIKRCPQAPRYIHVDLSTSGNQCDTGICMLHKEWNINPITQEREIMYITDFIIYGVAKTKIDLGAVERFLIDLVKERNVPICHVSFDQYQSELILQNLTASKCFTKVEKLSVDRSLEPYTSTASLIELGRVKVGQCDKLKRELEALIIENGKVTRTTELKDMADAIVGSVYSAQYNYKDDPIYQFIPYELQTEKKKIDYKELINEDNLLEEI